MSLSRPRLKIALATIAILSIVGANFVFSKLTNHWFNPKPPPHIALYVLKDGILLLSQEQRSFSNLSLHLTAASAGKLAYKHTFKELGPMKGMSAGYQEFVDLGSGERFPTGETPMTVTLVMKGYQLVTWHEAMHGQADRSFRSQTIAEVVNQMLRSGTAGQLQVRPPRAPNS